VRDDARKAARRRRHLELLTSEAKAESFVEQPITELERSQERALARRAIDTLSEKDREALLMREEGLSYDEIAEALELSLASVGTTLSRARRRLVEAYDELRRAGDEGRRLG
jgi:RNA polymerase sigma-70 factor (ECF subfamily)